MFLSQYREQKYLVCIGPKNHILKRKAKESACRKKHIVGISKMLQKIRFNEKVKAKVVKGPFK